MPTSNFQLPTPKHTVWALVVSLLIWSVPARPVAQLLNKQAPVIVGHYHLNVTSIEAHKKLKKTFFCCSRRSGDSDRR